MANRLDDQELKRAFSALPMPVEPSLRYRPLEKRHRAQPNIRSNRWYFPVAAVVALGLILLPGWIHGKVKSSVNLRSRVSQPRKLPPWRPLGLVSLDMVTSTQGWGFPMQGRNVYRTALGGRQWVQVGRLPKAQGSRSGDIVFQPLNSQDAFVVTDYMANHQAYLEVESTHNGGRVWHRRTMNVPGINLMESDHIYAGAMTASWANRQDGAFLIASAASPTDNSPFTTVKLYTTENGGQTWQGVSLGSQGLLPNLRHFGEVTRSSSNHLWLWANQHLWLYQLRQHIWQKESLGAERVVSPVQFWNQGVDGMVLTRNVRGESVWTTRDGGQHWSRTSILPTMASVHLSVSHGPNQWIWGVSSTATVQTSDTLWVTHDGGHVWSSWPGGPQGLPAHFVFEGAQFEGRQFGILQAVLSSRNLIPVYYVTHDGGRVWERLTPKARLAKSQMGLVNNLWLGN